MRQIPERLQCVGYLDQGRFFPGGIQIKLHCTVHQAACSSLLNCQFHKIMAVVFFTLQGDE